MPKRIRLSRDPYAEVRRDKGLESPQDRFRSPSGLKCPYCNSSSVHPLRSVGTDGFLQYKCGSCLKTFGKKV